MINLSYSQLCLSWIEIVIQTLTNGNGKKLLETSLVQGHDLHWMFLWIFLLFKKLSDEENLRNYFNSVKEKDIKRTN